MHITLITLLPDMLEALNHGIMGRAIQRQIITINTINPRDFSTDTHNSIDDRPYGGGPGMVMSYSPLKAAIDAARCQHPAHTPVIYLSPQGTPLRQQAVQAYAQRPSLILLAGRYEGIDERLLAHHVDQEVSIGDYVLSGGELPAMVLIDALTRLLPGSIGDEASHQQDSFNDGLLDYPHYTRPESIDGHDVPPTLLSGHHQDINQWRLQQSLGRTWQKRPDLIKRRILTKNEQQLLEDFKKSN